MYDTGDMTKDETYERILEAEETKGELFSMK